MAKIKWTKEQEAQIRKMCPSDRQVEAYKLGCEMLCETLRDCDNYNKKTKQNDRK